MTPAPHHRRAGQGCRSRLVASEKFSATQGCSQRRRDTAGNEKPRQDLQLWLQLYADQAQPLRLETGGIEAWPERALPSSRARAAILSADHAHQLRNSAVAREYGPRCIEILAQMAGLTDELPAAAAVRLAALKELLDRGFGRATVAAQRRRRLRPDLNSYPNGHHGKHRARARARSDQHGAAVAADFIVASDGESLRTEPGGPGRTLRAASMGWCCRIMRPHLMLIATASACPFRHFAIGEELSGLAFGARLSPSPIDRDLGRLRDSPAERTFSCHHATNSR